MKEVKAKTKNLRAAH